MKVYLASPQAFALPKLNKMLLSFYDLTISPIPFRKETFKTYLTYVNQKK